MDSGDEAELSEIVSSFKFWFLGSGGIEIYLAAAATRTGYSDPSGLRDVGSPEAFSVNGEVGS